MLNLERRTEIAAKIATIPDENKEGPAYKALYGDQVTIDDVSTVLAALRVPKCEEIYAALQEIPKEELETMSRGQLFERLYPDFVSLHDFRAVWVEEKAPKREKKAEKAKKKESGKTAPDAPKTAE
jgi:hypothetical protein